MPSVTMGDVAPSGNSQPILYEQPVSLDGIPAEVEWLRASARLVLALPREQLARHVAAVARIGDELGDLVELVTSTGANE